VSSRGGVRVPVALGLLIVIAAGVGSYGWLAASAPSRASSAAVPSVSPGPAAAMTSDPRTAEPASAPPVAAYEQGRLDALTGLVPAAFVPACVPVMPSGAGQLPTSAAQAAVRCRQAGNTVVYEALPDLASTQRTFASLVSGSGVKPGSGGCWDGSPGAVDYSYGQVACWTAPDGGPKTIAWTYEPASVVAAVSGTGGLRALVSWWWFHALLQPAANAAGLTPEEQALVARVPASFRGTCTHYDPAQDTTGYNPVGSLGSVDCFPKNARIADVGIFQFTTPDALAAWYDYRVSQTEEKPGEGGCLDGTPGETAWEHGRILCLVTAGRKAAIRWTDDRYQVYGALNGTGKDLPSLVKWWAARDLP
jgi:hypothetical protein